MKTNEKGLFEKFICTQKKDTRKYTYAQVHKMRGAKRGVSANKWETERI